jgi:serine/threonine-protein kinase
MDLESSMRSALLPDLEVVRPLGQGKHSFVYLARQPGLQRLVVVKVLRPDLASVPVMRRRFEREAQSAARLAHTHVPLIHHVARLPGDVPYIVMEYIEGRTLADIIDTIGPLALDKASATLAAIASALADAHEHGIVHRDVRPGNVMVESRTGRTVLMDFGIAGLKETGVATAERLTTAGERLGDLRYMSPEELRGEPATEQSDVYAFGILAYESLTGRGPFGAASDAKLAVAHLQAPPTPLLELRLEIGAAAAATIERCLAKDPNRRPRAGDLPELLRSVGAIETAAAAPQEPASPFVAFLADLKRRRVYQVGFAYLAVGFAVVEIANNFFPPLHISEGANTVVAAVVVVGFPVALVLSWLYDFTDGGIRRTQGSRPADGTRSFTRSLPWIALGLSVIAALLVGYWLLTP